MITKDSVYDRAWTNTNEEAKNQVSKILAEIEELFVQALTVPGASPRVKINTPILTPVQRIAIRRGVSLNNFEILFHVNSDNEEEIMVAFA